MCDVNLEDVTIVFGNRSVPVTSCWKKPTEKDSEGIVVIKLKEQRKVSTGRWIGKDLMRHPCRRVALPVFFGVLESVAQPMLGPVARPQNDGRVLR